MTDLEWAPPDLRGAVALVTGASRGVGRGVAWVLGEAGATVYITGRSVRGGATTENLPGTVDDTADEVTARGGIGVAVRCDHTVEAEVEALFERITAESGRLDLLVNNAWAGYERGDEQRFDAPFWQQPQWRYDLFAASLRGQFVASRLAVPLMLLQTKGLIVNISFTDGEVYLGQAAYDMCKTASDRLALGMSHDLRKHGVAAVALHPGFVRTERVEAAWDLLGAGPAQVVHSPEYVGRAIASLAMDPEVMAVSGRRLAVGDLAVKYGFTDVDGRQPPAFRLTGRMSLASRMERLNRVIEKAEGEQGNVGGSRDMTGHLAYRGASAAAIQSHYDRGNDFYALWLDETRSYSCALWAGPDDTLRAAQERKLDHLATDAKVRRAGRVLDVGCGWGGMLRRLVEEHEVAEVVGLTLAKEQAAYIRGFADARYDVRVQNWADHEPLRRDGTAPYDAIVSIGAFEHFADFGMTRAARIDAYRRFFDSCYEWLPSGGRLALQTNVKGNNVELDRKTVKDLLFIVDHIFPESELPWTSEILEASERKFDLVRARNDADHYARTCREWFDRLVANREDARELVGAERVADYERYLLASVDGFRNRHLGLVRMVFERM